MYGPRAEKSVLEISILRASSDLDAISAGSFTSQRRDARAEEPIAEAYAPVASVCGHGET